MPGSLERTKVQFPMWRKKVDSSLLINNMTPLPQWVVKMFGIESIEGMANTLVVNIDYHSGQYEGKVRIKNRNKRERQYFLEFGSDLSKELRKSFVMSYIRGVEKTNRKIRGYKLEKEEFPFWEFLDIEFNKEKRTFIFTVWYRQSAIFPSLFRYIAD